MAKTAIPPSTTPVVVKAKVPVRAKVPIPKPPVKRGQKEPPQEYLTGYNSMAKDIPIKLSDKSWWKLAAK